MRGAARLDRAMTAGVADGPGAAARAVRVMIADDDRFVRETLVAMIEASPEFEFVGAAEDAHEAVEVACRQEPDVGLIDVSMPGGGGPSATRGVSHSSPGTRVVALSSHGDRETVTEMLRAGAIGYLLKGTPVGGILDTIRRAARGERSLSPDVVGGMLEELSDRLASQEDDAQARREQEERIRNVLEDELLTMAFQPIVDLRAGSVVAFEALARFSPEPHRPPDMWFAEAAAVGRLPELELAAVRAALRALAKIPSHASLWVNLSPTTALEPGFRDALEGAELERVVIEITEHARVEDYEALTATIEPLRARGMRLAIDDAGAGFASLSHILQLAADVIKLDMTLTHGIETDRAKRALTSALVSFASETEATVVAEGIENQGEVDALRSIGVSFGQGYHLGRPAALGAPVG